MNISTFEEDLLDLEFFAEKLWKYIKAQRPFVDQSLVLSLNGGFGTGKTTFLKMWKHRLDKKPQENRPVVLSINAWEDDYCSNPLVSIVFALIEPLGDDNAKSKGLREALT